MNDPITIADRTASVKAQELIATYVVPNYGRLDLVPSRGEGSWLWDVEGKKYLDFGGGVAVTSLGHCPPAITRALEAQGRTLIHCSNWYQIPGQGELGKFLVEQVVQSPGKCFFCNSGAEANEGLIKLARKFGHAVPNAAGAPRFEIITFHQSFHGRTYGGISATAQQKVKDGFEPLVPGFVHVPFNDSAALRAALTENTVAILMEPVQGEGGVNVATRAFLEACGQICRERNMLLLFDEVQCGLGRAGHWCGWKAVLGDDTQIVPDAVSWAKGIAGGFPLGAVWISNRKISTQPTAGQLSDVLGAGSHGTTYGGSPLACAVALAVLREIHSANLCAHARKMGLEIKAAAQGIPFVKEVRGHGLLLGFVLDAAAIERSPLWKAGSTAALFLVKKLLEAGLLVVAAGPDVIRWLPPLNVTRGEIQMAFTILKQTLAALQ